MQKTVNPKNTMAIRMLVFKKRWLVLFPLFLFLPMQAALAGFTLPGCFVPNSTAWIGVKRTQDKELRPWSLLPARIQDFTAQNLSSGVCPCMCETVEETKIGLNCHHAAELSSIVTFSQVSFA